MNPIQEGKVFKGGRNLEKPSTPRPETKPAGQDLNKSIEKMIKDLVKGLEEISNVCRWRLDKNRSSKALRADLQTIDNIIHDMLRGRKTEE